MTSSLPCTSVPRPWRRPVTDTGTQDKEHNAIITWCVQCTNLKPYALSIKKITEIYGQEISPLPGEQVLYGQDGQDLLLRLGSMPQEGGEAATEARYKKSSYVVLVIVLERTTILHVLLYDISSTKGTVQNDVAYYHECVPLCFRTTKPQQS